MKKAVAAAMAAIMTGMALISPADGPAVLADGTGNASRLWQEFQNPAKRSGTVPLWFWNKNVSDMDIDTVLEIIQKSAEESGYAGFAILPNWQSDYMSEEYFAFYGKVLEKAKELGLTMCLYDENGFPSGPAGGQLAARYPDSTTKRLDMVEADVSDGSTVQLILPDGRYMGAVAMNMDTYERVDISDAFDAAASASGVKGTSTFTGLDGYGPEKAVDGDPNTRWNSAAGNLDTQYLELYFGKDVTFDKAYILQSNEGALQRAMKYAVEYWDGAQWVSLVDGGELGAEKTHEFSAVTTDKVRLALSDFSAKGDCITVSEFALYNQGEKVTLPQNVISGTRVLSYDAPEGNWKIMAFVTVKDTTAPNVQNNVDYLSAEAVSHFIELSYEAYYERFPEYFGTVITTAFYDEPTLKHSTGRRQWTGSFNEEFEEAHGYNPITLYPAMFMDIGDDTESARVALYGMRNQMFAENYIKQINDWCADHGLQLQGHTLDEEVVNPTQTAGDLMKLFEHQAIPGVDTIFFYGYTQEAFKIVSSSAYNWDKQKVMCEAYGGMSTLSIDEMYKVAMDLYTKGINVMIPHAVWYDDNPQNISYLPELSYRNPTYADELPVYNQYIARLNTLLQGGRHAADIGMLYPIYGLNANYVFGEDYCIPESADYMKIGELLSKDIRRDFTYIHPEILDGRMTVDGNTLKLNNDLNFEEYKVFIMPGSSTVSLSNMQKIKEFYDNGGKVIATGELPAKAVEPGKDAEVRALVEAVFGIDPLHQNDGKSQITYSASSEFNDYYGAESAFDGAFGDGSRWNAASFSGGDQWLEVDFGKEVSLNRTVITENPSYRITGYKIQYWDGSDWVTCSTGTSIGERKEDTFDTVTTRKLRLYVDSVTTDSASIQEFEVYLDNGKNLAIPSQDDYVSRSNAQGGKSYFIQYVDEALLASVLDDAQAVYDVEISGAQNVTGGNLQYIHKVVEDTDVYFIGNSSDQAQTLTVQLRGKLEPTVWDPYTGTYTVPAFRHDTVDGQEVTIVTLLMEAVQSLFIVDGEMPAVETPDTEALEALIAEAEKVNATQYADGELKNAFVQALTGAKSALTDAGTQAEVDAARNALQTAMDALLAQGTLPAPTTAGSTGPDESATTQPGESAAPTTAQTAPTTGAVTNTALPLLAAGAALGAVVLVRRRRVKQK